MQFLFRAWPPLKTIGDPQQLAEAASCIADSIRDSGAFSSDGTAIRFEVIDIRRGYYNQKQVNRLLDRLHGLLLVRPEQLRHVSGASRFLFVGSASALAVPEDEWDRKRSIKRDAELAIRTLQNYGVAHYGHIGESGAEVGPDHSLARSAVIGLARHYRNRSPTGTANTLQGIALDLESLVRSARRLPEFAHLGSLEATAGPGSEEPDLGRLLREMALLYQLGKGDRPRAFDPVARLERLRRTGGLTFGGDTPHSSYGLFVDLLADLGEWAEVYPLAVSAGKSPEKTSARSKRSRHAQSIAEMSFKLARYDLLRDFGRVLGKGALRRLGEQAREPRILIIDDDFFRILAAKTADASRRRLIKGLSLAFGVAWDHASVHVVPSNFVDARTDLLSSDHIANLLSAGAAREAVDLNGRPVEASVDLHDYLAVLIDPEARADGLGPIRVQRLASHLRRGARPEPAVMGRPGRAGRPAPPLIAFSRKESSGYVQQCLNMGAAAFVAKHRPYHLLFDLARVLREEPKHRLSTDRASQFRLLHGLKPHVAAKLQSRDGPSYVYGNRPLSGEFVSDPREEAWIRALPKADLHYHIGTAIRPEMISLMAMNTVGHFLPPARLPHLEGKDPAGGAVPLISRIARVVALTAWLEAELGESGQLPASRLELLAAAADAVTGGETLEKVSFALGDALIKRLAEPNDRCDLAHATALLVATIAAQGKVPWEPVIGRFFEALRSAAPPPDPSAGPISFSSRAALALEAIRAREHFTGVACRWSGSATQGNFEALIASPPTEFWNQLEKDLRARIGYANRELLKARRDASRWVENKGSAAKARAKKWMGLHTQSQQSRAKGSSSKRRKCPDRPLALADYVRVAEGPDQYGLALYLRGADLLGSAHCQYPENLWLAALAITQDNAEENVVYSEIRCETTGYTKAGMGARDATEMLRHGFNLASLFIAGSRRDSASREAAQPNPLVRTNILIAAKRHKDEPDARAAVQLLESYLERRPGSADAGHSRRLYRTTFGRSLPPWWRPCDVVGFDISGDESKEPDWLSRVMEPLAALSSPVTIHAGEAASASSIWRAVYKLNALRIGHGLRLSENMALLGYCVREGICMELCPNSNHHTNRFEPEQHSDANLPVSLPRYEYPLLHYMREGMEVTIGTDNRYLHRLGQESLTSEYMTAARLVGGLTRWEALQIVKAGFKNAFLDKAEVRDIVQSVEKEIYRIIATDNV